MADTPRPRPRRPTLAPPTLVLLVRHGTTPTTGQVLPGRARGLHLADSGRAQAEAVAARLAVWAKPPEAKAPDGKAPDGKAADGKAADGKAADGKAADGKVHRAPAHPAPPSIAALYASPLERTRETAAPIAKALGIKVVIDRGLLECDFGTWTGRTLRELGKLPEWTTVQRYPSGFRFPDGESFMAMQARIVDSINAICSRHRGETVVAVSHADPIKAAVADAMGTHLDLFQRIVISPCSVTAISYGPVGPTVLAVNSTGSLADLRPS